MHFGGWSINLRREEEKKRRSSYYYSLRVNVNQHSAEDDYENESEGGRDGSGLRYQERRKVATREEQKNQATSS
jgi:hypothetical protein